MDDGEYILAGGGWKWTCFGWWWLVVGGGGYILASGFRLQLDWFLDQSYKFVNDFIK